jgi:hypothetical protein
MTEKIDPITFELFKNAIFSIADEMALTVVRTTCSGAIGNSNALSVHAQAACPAPRGARAAWIESGGGCRGAFGRAAWSMAGARRGYGAGLIGRRRDAGRLAEGRAHR